MNDAPARLVIRQGPTPDAEYLLTETKTGIGRAPTNEIPIPDPEISRCHAQIIRQGDGYAVEDLGSTNGTFVNGHRLVGLTPLKHGDTIDFGESVSVTFLHAAPGGPAVYDAFAEDTAPELPLLAPPAAQARGRGEQDAFALAQPKRGSSRRLLLGCGCAFLALVFLCAALLFFLDAYEQGRLLYCGFLRPLFEILLGSRFAPICP